VTTLIGPRPALEAGAAGHKAVWERLAPYVSGAYANFQAGTGPADVQAVYPDATYRRLAEVKHRWDPANLFTGNHNVAPAAT
jgi:hypothetical protein